MINEKAENSKENQINKNGVKDKYNHILNENNKDKLR